MDRTILHCDCNSFFASVETLLDPSLADGPTAVCGDPESRHGIIPRAQFAEEKLTDADHLEVVCFVGGG